MPSLRRDTRPHEVLYLGRQLRALRRTIGWRQLDLARRAGVSQTWVSAIERGRVARLRLDTAERLLAAMGARLVVTVDAPYLADRRLQRDIGHARCIAYVVGRLRRAGWQVATELEVGGDRSRGWIDVVAYHPTSHVLLVIEVKTELHDLGAIERRLGWYEREAWAAARRLGWRPRIALGVLLFLATTAVDERIAANREAFANDFPGRAKDLAPIVAGAAPSTRRRHVALIDPHSRRRGWLRPLQLDGRRTSAPYRDYAGFVSWRTGRSDARPAGVPREAQNSERPARRG